MPLVFTDAAKSLYGQRDAGDISGISINNLRIVTGVTRYNAQASDTRLPSGGNVIRENIEPSDITANAGTVVFSYIVDRPEAITGQAIGLFANDTLILVLADADKDAFVKAANTAQIVSFVWAYRGVGSPTPLTHSVTVTAPQKASGATVIAGADDNKYVTPAGIKAWWAALTILASKLPNIPANKITGTLSTARIPNINANKITSGVLNLLRIPNLPANKITSGVLNEDRIPDLPASRITSGILSSNRLPRASDLASGIIEIATNTETKTGSDSTRAVSPAGLKSTLDSTTATATAKGMVELATKAEVTGAGGKTVMTSDQWRVYAKGAVPTTIPTSVAIYAEEE